MWCWFLCTSEWCASGCFPEETLSVKMSSYQVSVQERVHTADRTASLRMGRWHVWSLVVSGNSGFGGGSTHQSEWLTVFHLFIQTSQAGHLLPPKKLLSDCVSTCGCQWDHPLKLPGEPELCLSQDSQTDIPPLLPQLIPGRSRCPCVTPPGKLGSLPLLFLGIAHGPATFANGTYSSTFHCSKSLSWLDRYTEPCKPFQLMVFLLRMRLWNLRENG